MKIRDLNSFQQKALHWAAKFDLCCCFDSNHYTDPYGKFDFLVAAGEAQALTKQSGHAFADLKSFYDTHRNWMFGLLGYDLKNETEQLESENPDALNFPELFFFVPKYLIVVMAGEVQVLIGDSSVLDEIDLQVTGVNETPALNIQGRISRNDYIGTVERLQEHIVRGDIYEVNFCQEFFAENAIIDPMFVLKRLNEVSPTPFFGFFKIHEKYILSASPERFLCKRGSQLISQPIKGTARRGKTAAEDLQIRMDFQEDAKEQAENVMIVDLVRNDLTKSAVKGSVKVDELFGIYGFHQVYQMISTISCELDPEMHVVDAIKNAFPMGSMTGAPKLKAMQLIEHYEFSKRGAYSGAIGYFSPDGDFDFNVVIRSILYDAASQYLSFQVGGAITFAASAAREYEECILKASAMTAALENK